MGIRTDAGKLLIFIYNHKVRGEKMPRIDELCRITKWTEDRCIFALQYLVNEKLVEGNVLIVAGSTKPKDVPVRDLTPEGTKTVEDGKGKFKRQFNSINKASGWGYSSKSFPDAVITAMALVTCEGM